MNRAWKIVLGIIVIAAACGVIFSVFKEKIGAVRIPPNEEVLLPGEGPATSTDPLISRLVVPQGFALNVYARNVPGARVIEMDPKGRILVSQTDEDSIVALEDTDNDGVADSRRNVITGLNKPHGMAFECHTAAPQCHLYVAEHDQLSRYTYNDADRTFTDRIELLDIEASASDRHSTRTLLFMPSPNENTLLISVGSSCDVCQEEGTMRGRIMAYDIVTKEVSEYARGLRNSVFMTLDPLSGKVFATEMGRDGLGDNLPPDEINIIEKGKNYGWPVCYGKNIHDTDFDKNITIRNPCMEPLETSSFIDLQAHSAPLGLSFIPEEGWPEEYWYNLLVAYHGSWNRSEPTGYKIMRLKMNSKGEYTGTENFITGWLTPEGTKIGRPADIKIFSGGTGYITDDLNGVVYRLTVL
jgi:glucose/arabinose dehydrogenase